MKKIILLAFVPMLLWSLTSVIYFSAPVKAEAKIIYVDSKNTGFEDGSKEHPYNTIKEGINAADPGYMVLVRNGTYYEWNIVLDKDNLSLIGENKGNTIIDGMDLGWIITVTAQNVTVASFTIKNSPGTAAGVFLNHATKSKISDNIIKYHDSGVYSVFSNGNVIENNWVANNNEGIILSSVCKENKVRSNNVTGNTLFAGIDLSNGAHDNQIENNNIFQNKYGILITFENNTIFGNRIINNDVGIYEYSESTCGYRIFHNNFINNTKQIDSGNQSINIWDNGYPSGGNYWSDYNGTDFFMGTQQNITGRDGIIDAIYFIDANNTDRYPLMGPISFFNAGTWDEITYYVHTVSNSTISDFYLGKDDKLIGFNVNGPDGTVGFCRVTIPKELMWCDVLAEWNVTINGGPSTYLNAMEDNDYTYLYFTYNHGIQEVQIRGIHVIPEFPTWTSILLILIVLTVATAIYKRKLLKTPIH